ncbi:hypothetical protein R3P38DRAFT_3189756 [Favolaschia claudopus]|uniref:Uncharacterized protein n=1 Tax=Favolaschia claudopus TaxID=2862362 RepID=A0AAW0BN21_9AGAR
MAVPQSQTMLDISGKYTLNKALSDSDASDKILEQQGVSYLKRKATGMAGATILIKNYKGDNGVEILEVIPQIMGATPKGEIRPLNWTEQAIDHPLFGKVTTKNRRVKLAELEDENLKKGWTNETLDAGVFLSHMAGDKRTLVQAWGLQYIDGKRYHARQATFVGPKGNVIHARFVYDYGFPSSYGRFSIQQLIRSNLGF